MSNRQSVSTLFLASKDIKEIVNYITEATGRYIRIELYVPIYRHVTFSLKDSAKFVRYVLFGSMAYPLYAEITHHYAPINEGTKTHQIIDCTIKQSVTMARVKSWLKSLKLGKRLQNRKMSFAPSPKEFPPVHDGYSVMAATSRTSICQIKKDFKRGKKIKNMLDKARPKISKPIEHQTKRIKVVSKIDNDSISIYNDEPQAIDEWSPFVRNDDYATNSEKIGNPPVPQVQQPDTPHADKMVHFVVNCDDGRKYSGEIPDWWMTKTVRVYMDDKLKKMKRNTYRNIVKAAKDDSNLMTELVEFLVDNEEI